MIFEVLIGVGMAVNMIYAERFRSRTRAARKRR